jgi:hypothetical protein
MVWGNSAAMAIRYGLDVPGIGSRWGRLLLQPFRPVLGPTQPSGKWVPSLFPGDKTGRVWD